MLRFSLKLVRPYWKWLSLVAVAMVIETAMSFTLIALAVVPLVVLFAYRLRASVKTATREVRRRQSEIVSIVQEGLGSMRVVKAFAQGRFERERLGAKSLESVHAALHARRVRSLFGPVVTALVAFGTAGVLRVQQPTASFMDGRLVSREPDSGHRASPSAR